MPVPQSARTLYHLVLNMLEREAQDQPSRSHVQRSRTPPTDLVARALWRRETRLEQGALRQQQEAQRRRKDQLRHRAERRRHYNDACSLRRHIRRQCDELKETRDDLHAKHSFWSRKFDDWSKMVDRAVRRRQEISETDDADGYHVACAVARAQASLNTARTQIQVIARALEDAQEMLRHAEESLEQVEGAIETLLSEGPVEVEVPWPVYDQYRALLSRSLDL